MAVRSPRREHADQRQLLPVAGLDPHLDAADTHLASERLVGAGAMDLPGVTVARVRHVEAQRQPALTGMAGMIGEAGRALTPIGPAQPGRVAVHGEIWDAAAAESIAEGARVRIVSIEGLRVTVRQE